MHFKQLFLLMTLGGIINSALAQSNPSYHYELTGSGTTRWLIASTELPQVTNPYQWILSPGFIQLGQSLLYYQDALDRLIYGHDPFTTPIGVDLRGSVGFRLVWHGGDSNVPAPTRQFYRSRFNAMARGRKFAGDFNAISEQGPGGG
ncbi:hypothetical protein QPK87_37810 [Kamptonema cortianum]|nr:hypothetical protein [Kamptonema cortianum]